MRKTVLPSFSRLLKAHAPTHRTRFAETSAAHGFPRQTDDDESALTSQPAGDMNYDDYRQLAGSCYPPVYPYQQHQQQHQQYYEQYQPHHHQPHLQQPLHHQPHHHSQWTAAAAAPPHQPFYYPHPQQGHLGLPQLPQLCPPSSFAPTPNAVLTPLAAPLAPHVHIPGLRLLHNMPSPATPLSTPPSQPAPPSPAPVPAKKGIKRKSARAAKAAKNPPVVAKKGFAARKSPEIKNCFDSQRHKKPSPRPDRASSAAAARNDPGRERQVPGPESGGVPEPTPLYLTQSFGPPVALPQPRRVLVILDLNGTVLYRPTRHQPTNFVERPHARRFLAYCLEAFHLAIWSSARPQNVQNMLAQLLTTDQRERCVVIWARDRLGLSHQDYNSRVQCYKRLVTVWNNEKVQASHPDADRGGRWDQSNTVLIDDSREKGRSEPHNILAVPEFSGLENEKVDVLPQVHDYLNVLCHQQDISRYMRQSPFTLDPTYSLPAPDPTET